MVPARPMTGQNIYVIKTSGFLISGFCVRRGRCARNAQQWCCLGLARCFSLAFCPIIFATLAAKNIPGGDWKKLTRNCKSARGGTYDGRHSLSGRTSHRNIWRQRRRCVVLFAGNLRKCCDYWRGWDTTIARFFISFMVQSGGKRWPTGVMLMLGGTVCFPSIRRSRRCTLYLKTELKSAVTCLLRFGAAVVVAA